MAENCVSCSALVIERCVECGAGLCSGHIFECRKCNKPMCRSCWTKLGRDFCKACSVPVVKVLGGQASLVGVPAESYWDRTHLIQQSGQVPQHCGEAMVAEDDHGRFVCFVCGHRASL